MTIIKIEHELTEEQEKKIMDAINTIAVTGRRGSGKTTLMKAFISYVPDDMFCCPPRMTDDVIASKIWTKDDIKGTIEESGYELTEELLNQTILDMEDMAPLNDCQDYEWDFVNGSIKNAYEEILARHGWIKTDDTQYLKKLRAGVYKLVQSTELPDGNYSVFTNTIVIANWKDSDGLYDADCRSIIKSYYGSIEEFEDKYPALERREQVLAEMLFESTCSYDSEETETVNDKLKAQKVIDKFLFLCE